MGHSDLKDGWMNFLDTAGKSGFAFACHMLHNRDDALDAVQTTVAAVWRDRRKLRADRDPHAWFFRVLRNRCIDMIRARRRQPQPIAFEPGSDTGDGPAGDASRQETIARVRAALSALPEQAREIILLRDFHDLSYAQIAEILGIASGTVMSRLHRARCALRDVLAAQGCDDE